MRTRKTEPVQFLVDEELSRKIEAAAAADRRPVSSFIRGIVECYFDAMAQSGDHQRAA